MVYVIKDDSKELKHYGILRRSGRYPWGSGDNVAQRSKSFLDIINDLMTRLGLTEKEVAEYVSPPDNPISLKELRALKTIARAEHKAAQITMAHRLKETKGYSNKAIAERMGLPGESSVRALLAPGIEMDYHVAKFATSD